MDSFVLELSSVLLGSLVLAVLFRRLRLPSTLAYLASGILLGPLMLNFLSQLHIYRLFGELGISVLLFITGSHLRLRGILEHRRVVLAYLLATMLLAPGYLLLLQIWGVEWPWNLLIALALTFSSTIVSTKLLIENKELENLHGSLTLIILVLQDLLAAVLLGFVDLSSLNPWALMVALTLVIILSSSYGQRAIEFVLAEVSRSTELLFLFSLAWMTMLSALFQLAGLGLELGALVAGVLLANTSFSEEIASRLRPLQDFFLLFFFVYLGANFGKPLDARALGLVILLGAILTISKLLAYATSLGIAGYSFTTSLYSGMYLSTSSEFSLILLYLLSNRLPYSMVQELVMVIISSLVFAIMLIPMKERFRMLLSRLLSLGTLELLKEPIYELTELRESYRFIVFGITKLSREFLFSLDPSLRSQVLVVDLNPEKVLMLRKRGFRAIYGDAMDAYFLDSLNLENLEAVISFIPDLEVNGALAEYFVSRHPNVKLISIATSKLEKEELRKKGFHVVLGVVELMVRELFSVLGLGPAQ